MQTFYWKAGLAALLAMTLMGCQSPETPKPVSEAFWRAMAEGDADEVVKWSTRTDAAGHERFPDQWSGAEPGFGRVVIDADQASVVTRLPHRNDAKDPLKAQTYLVRQDGDWFVDYQKTRQDFTQRSLFDTLIDEANQWGETLSQRLDLEDWSKKMDDLAQQLDELSSQAAENAETAIDDYGQALRERLESLRQSIERALENNKDAPNDARQALRTTLIELDQRIEELKEPTAEALAKASSTLADAQERLKEISEAEYGELKQQWNAGLEQIETRTRAFFKDLRKTPE